MEIWQCMQFINKHNYEVLHDSTLWKNRSLNVSVNTLQELAHLVTQYNLRHLEKVELEKAPTITEIKYVRSQFKWRTKLKLLEIKVFRVAGTNNRITLKALLLLFSKISRLELSGYNYPPGILSTPNLDAVYVSGLSMSRRKVKDRLDAPHVYVSTSTLSTSQLPSQLESITASTTLFSFDAPVKREFPLLVSITDSCLDPRLLQLCSKTLQSVRFERFRFDPLPILTSYTFPALTKLSCGGIDMRYIQAPALSHLEICMPCRESFDCLRHFKLTHLSLHTMWAWHDEDLKNALNTCGENIQELNVFFIYQRDSPAPHCEWLSSLKRVENLELHSRFLPPDLTPFLGLTSLRNLKLTACNVASWLRFAHEHNLSFNSLELHCGTTLYIDVLPYCEFLLLDAEWIETSLSIKFGQGRPPRTCIVQTAVQDSLLCSLINTEVVIGSDCKFPSAAQIDKWQFKTLTLHTRQEQWLALKHQVDYPVFIQSETYIPSRFSTTFNEQDQ